MKTPTQICVLIYTGAKTKPLPGEFPIKSLKRRWLLAFRKTNQNKFKVWTLIWTRQNNVHSFHIYIIINMPFTHSFSYNKRTHRQLLDKKTVKILTFLEMSSSWPAALAHDLSKTCTFPRKFRFFPLSCQITFCLLLCKRQYRNYGMPKMCTLFHPVHTKQAVIF